MKKTFISLLTLTLLAGVANAQNIVVNTDAPTFGPDNSLNNFSLTFPATSIPSGYSLVSATLRIFGSQSVSAIAVNASGVTRTNVRITVNAFFSIFSNSMDSTLTTFTANPAVLSTGLQNYAPFEQKNFGPSSANIDTTATPVTNASAYLAGGTVDCDIFNGVTTSGGGGNINTGIDPTTTFNGRIAFTFAPIVGAAAPEPGTLVFLALGGGLVLVKRRRAN